MGLALGLVLVLAGGAYLLYPDRSEAPSTLASAPCVTTSPTATPPAVPPTVRAAVLPRPQQIRLSLLNGTPRAGLAKTVGDQLAARGFVVTAQANAPAPLAGPSQVAFGPGAAPAATLVARWVRGSRTVAASQVPRGTVQVTLGSSFQRLATQAEVAALAAPRVQPTTAAPAPTPTSCSR